jgi:hypothetical protein
MTDAAMVDFAGNDVNARYKIVRNFRDGKNRAVRGKGNLSLAEAKAHCGSPEASWKTCTNPALCRLTERKGPWFDGFQEA